ncbi:single-strand DNA-binding protein [Cnuella takakiae]|uniref:Single-stranded DNA-binding protein n=1 Tax=Cnuella takakiae TaxID=1302690 RepID=A0A1M4ZG25_9BACT|nr:single-stranded DNA-binding protein [Cnuella takakiae]OLY94230.1 hypothetical protein BUE76_21845 [Cnuella takakiae]SHF16536.1 single-strand DNA-binding protein [Cnuella takakiae]
MNIIGRTTKDAVVNTLSDGRKVVLFSVAVNDRYRHRVGDAVKTSTYYDCSYWLSEKLAEHLKKGTLVKVSGRVYVSAYTSADGSPRASLKCTTPHPRVRGINSSAICIVYLATSNCLVLTFEPSTKRL